MAKTVKIAFVDSDTNEFYVRSNTETDFVFSRDVAKAKLYVMRSEIRQFFEYTAIYSNRNLKCVEVEVEFKVLGDRLLDSQLVEGGTLDTVEAWGMLTAGVASAIAQATANVPAQGLGFHAQLGDSDAR